MEWKENHDKDETALWEKIDLEDYFGSYDTFLLQDVKSKKYLSVTDLVHDYRYTVLQGKNDSF